MTLPTSWHGSWAGLKAAVFGLGKSGFSVVDTLSELGVEVTVYAHRFEPELADLAELVGAKLVQSDAVSDVNFAVDFAVVSPGFAPGHPIVLELGQRGVQILGDIELAYRVSDKVRAPRWVTITGTNGKTTTTELTAAMLRAGGHRAIACGNIGSPILDAIRDPEGFDFLVVELSSFQLHYLREIEVEVSAFLNLAEDHYDWHGSAEAYFQAKAKIYNGTKLAIVYNEQDPLTLQAAEQAEVVEGCRAVAFTLGMPAVSMVGYVEEFLVDRAFVENRREAAQEIATLEDLDRLGVRSPHLMANVAAATTIARACGVSPAAIRTAITNFELSPHRIQLVAKQADVVWVDDSKATNAHAAAASLSSFESVVWIVGGLLKGVDPEPLILAHLSRLRAAVIIGRDTSELERLFSLHAPDLPVRVVSKGSVMEAAVAYAAELAQPGDIVLLAPAAASMDQFKDYSDRGNQFQAAVRGLVGNE
jgi:UDP-N-acetylmuramoylalanine--D-glutamate ligase